MKTHWQCSEVKRGRPPKVHVVFVGPEFQKLSKRHWTAEYTVFTAFKKANIHEFCQNLHSRIHSIVRIFCPTVGRLYECFAFIFEKTYCRLGTARDAAKFRRPIISSCVCTLQFPPSHCNTINEMVAVAPVDAVNVNVVWILQTAKAPSVRLSNYNIKGKSTLDNKLWSLPYSCPFWARLGESHTAVTRININVHFFFNLSARGLNPNSQHSIKKIEICRPTAVRACRRTRCVS